jgi:hypothetical protein
VSLNARRRPAQLWSPAETETTEGGQARAFSLLTPLWVELTLGPGQEREFPGLTAQRLERATATARLHLDAARGQQLRLPGQPDWRVQEVQVHTPSPGLMTLVLERQR